MVLLLIQSERSFTIKEEKKKGGFSQSVNTSQSSTKLRKRGWQKEKGKGKLHAYSPNGIYFRTFPPHTPIPSIDLSSYHHCQSIIHLSAQDDTGTGLLMKVLLSSQPSGVHAAPCPEPFLKAAPQMLFEDAAERALSSDSAGSQGATQAPQSLQTSDQISNRC